MTVRYLEDFAAGQIFNTGRLVSTRNRSSCSRSNSTRSRFTLDEEAALRSPFRGLAASGWHTAAMTMRLMVDGEFKPAGGILGVGFDNLSWPRPVRPGDELQATSEILEVRPSKSKPDRGMIQVRTTTFNQNDEPVMVFTGNLLVPRRPASASGGSAMRILVIGAGALGGYFGGRLLEAGRDVTFLVRERRAAQLAKTGLVIRSPSGDVALPNPPTVLAKDLASDLREPFDLILLSAKAYDLASAANSFAPAVGPNTAILPVLNGMAHLDYLGERFGARAVLGGQCLISATLDVEGRIILISDLDLLAFGEQDGTKSARVQTILAALSGAHFQVQLSTTILQEMWEKWAFIATGAGITCLMRASFGDIVTAGAGELTTRLYDECCAIAKASGFPPGEATVKRSLGMLTSPTSILMASMLRDIERGAPIESDHVVGNLLQRGGGGPSAFPLLRIAYAHLKSYEARRKREGSAAAA